MFMKEDLLDIKLYNIFEDESKDFEKKISIFKGTCYAVSN